MIDKDATGYKGLIIMARDIQHGIAYAVPAKSVHEWKQHCGDSIYLGSTEVDITFENARDAEIDALQMQIERERANSHQRIVRLESRIRDLRYLPHQ